MAWWQAVAWVVSSWAAAQGGPACAEVVALDRARTAAITAADSAGLNAVYADPALAQADRNLIAAWSDRGLRLDGGPLVLERCTEVTRTAETATVLVTDWVGPTRAVAADGVTTDLPRDRPTDRRIDLRRIGGQWRIAAVAVLE